MNKIGRIFSKCDIVSDHFSGRVDEIIDDNYSSNHKMAYKTTIDLNFRYFYIKDVKLFYRDIPDISFELSI